MFFFSDEQYSESNKEFASPIIHSFKQLIYNPGVWDIFVLKLVEVNFIAIVNYFFFLCECTCCIKNSLI